MTASKAPSSRNRNLLMHLSTDLSHIIAYSYNKNEQDIASFKDGGLVKFSYIYNIDNTLLRALIIQTFDENGELHSFNDSPAKITYEVNPLRIKDESWFKHGELHREGKPAQLIYFHDESAGLSEERYMQEGVLHRDGDQPAVIKYDQNRNVMLIEEYAQHGRYHRESGPALISLMPGAESAEKEWYYRGARHNKGLLSSNPIRRTLQRKAWSLKLFI